MMKNKQNITGLKARKSLAQGNALCHGRRNTRSPERAQSGLFYSITPFQGIMNVMHSVRRALPCANDCRALSPYDPSNCYM
jgi:hypothetical protein